MLKINEIMHGFGPGINDMLRKDLFNITLFLEGGRFWGDSFSMLQENTCILIVSWFEEQQKEEAGTQLNVGKVNG